MKRREETKEKQTKCSCPYCEGEVVISAIPSYCQPCGVTMHYCASCQIAVAKEAEVCPQCGGKLEVR
ncbi:hypothetical protein ACFLVH_06535 [Chloroflexota bacterium]